MDKQIVAEKLESLRHCIVRIEQKRPSKVTELKEDFDLQDIISINLVRAVQLCVDIASHIISSTEEKIPDTMGETFKILHKLDILSESITQIMIKAVGFRNISVHNYHAVNWEIVFNICTRQIDDFKQFAREVNKYVSDC